MTTPALSQSFRRKIWFYRIFSWWPLLVWLGVACLAVWGYLNTQKEHRFVGRVVSETIVVASLEDARVAKVELKVGQRVVAGDVLVQLDTASIDSEIQELGIEIKQEHRERERRYVEARHRLLEQRQKLTLAQNEARARLKVLETENESLEKLREQRLVSQGVYFDTLEEVEALRSSLASFPTFLGEVEEELQRLEASVSVWDIADSGDLLKSDERIQFLEQKRNLQTLRAPRSAIVSEVLVKTGEVALAGETIVRLSLPGSNQVVGFVPESELAYPEKGEVLYVSSLSTGGDWREARVSALAPEVVMVPDQVSPLPGRMISGRYCYLEMVNPLAMLSGETVMIALDRPGLGNFLKRFRDVDSVTASSEPESKLPLSTSGSALSH